MDLDKTNFETQFTDEKCILDDSYQIAADSNESPGMRPMPKVAKISTFFAILGLTIAKKPRKICCFSGSLFNIGYVNVAVVVWRVFYRILTCFNMQNNLVNILFLGIFNFKAKVLKKVYIFAKLAKNHDTINLIRCLSLVRHLIKMSIMVFVFVNYLHFTMCEKNPG